MKQLLQVAMTIEAAAMCAFGKGRSIWQRCGMRKLFMTGKHRVAALLLARSPGRVENP